MDEVKARWAFCPLRRFRAFLENRDLWSEHLQRKTETDIAQEIDAAVDAYLAYSPPAVEQMFAHTYASFPTPLTAQREEALRFA
jgi:TPP-dependent pyruvate/acetoin dehydrogenase alpha subunit